MKWRPWPATNDDRMDFFNLIVDRVGDRNVFNLFTGAVPGRETHLQTRVDDDLLDDFLHVVRRVALLSSDHAGEYQDLTVQLFRTGEIVYREFFPPSIREILRRSEGGVLFLHLDSLLGHIPWELMYDGSSFLADRFIIGRNVAGTWNGETNHQDRTRLRMLIVADPSEDLPSAREEGNALFETLNAEISPDLIDIKFISGQRVTRLSLLEDLQEKDIVHFAGHTGVDGTGEAGWLLSGGKVLRSSEIELLDHPPTFVFSNSCSSFGASSIENSNRLARAFLRSGVAGYIGTSWDVPDSSETAEFALEFYRNIFLERSLGEALFEARHRAKKRNPERDLTWTAYSLHGSPLQRLFRYPARRSFDASRSILNTRRVIEDFPVPVAASYSRFLEMQERTGIPESSAFGPLSMAFLWMLAFGGAALLALYRSLDLKGEQPAAEEGREPEYYAAQLHRFARRLNVLNMESRLPGIVQPFLLHRENIDKMCELVRVFRQQNPQEIEALSYLITFQYLLENLFVDFALFTRVDVFYNMGPDWPGVLFRGTRATETRMVPVYGHHEELEADLRSCNRKVCLLTSTRKSLLDLSPFLQWRSETGVLHSTLFDLDFHVDLPE